jgi:hypothetical protein
MRIPTYQVREEKMLHDGATQEKIDARTAELKQMAETCRNRLIQFGSTMTEIAPVGIIIALVSAAFSGGRSTNPCDVSA